MKLKKLALALVLGLGATALYAQSIDLSLSASGWVTGGNTGGTQTGNYGSSGVGVQSATGSQTISCCGPNTWVISPYTGSTMLGMQPGSTQNYSAMTTALGLSAASVTALNNEVASQGGSITSATWVSKDFTFQSNTQFKMAWIYSSTDYVPFNDGSITTLVNNSSATTLGKINGVSAQYILLGATNPGTGNYSTDSYGSTGWQWVNYDVTTAGTYKLGFSVFNQGDTALSPVLFVNDGLGTVTKNGVAFNPVAPNDPNMPTTNPDGTISGGGGTPTPPAVTVTGTNTVLGASSYANTTGNSLITSSSTIADNYLTRNFNILTLTGMGRLTTTLTTDVTSYSDNTTTSTAGTPIVVAENYINSVDVTHNDVATSVTPNSAARTHVDTGSVTLATPTVTPNANYSIRTGSATTSGLISRTSTTPTLFVYDRSTTTVTADTFGPTSIYANTSNTVNTNSVVQETYNVVKTEDFIRTVTKDVLDTATGSTVIGEIQRVSNGIDAGSLVNSKSIPTTVNNGKSITVNAGGVISANELYTVTTPTRFTYNRLVNTTVTDAFGPGSVYSNTSGTTGENSTVTGDYDVVSHDSIGRGAAYDVAVNLRTDQVQTVNKLQGMMARGTEFGDTITYKRYDHRDDGYTGFTNLFGVGHRKDIEGDMILGLGINKLNTYLSGNNSNVRAETVQLGATLSKKDVNGFDLSATAQHSMTNYDASATPSVMVRTAGDDRLLATQPINRTLPAVTGKTSGTDSSISVRAVGPSLDPAGIVRPVIGATYGARNVSGYTGNIEVLPGTVVSNRIGAVNDDYGYGTVGAVAKYDMFNASVLHHTDGVNQIGVGLQQQKDDLTFNIRADRLQTKQGGSNVFTAAVVYKF